MSMRLWGFILAVFAAGASTQPLSQNTEEVAARKDLYILTLMPYFVPGFAFELHYSFDVGNAFYPALQLAAEMVNNRTDLLQGYNLKLLVENSGCIVPFRGTEGLITGLSLGKDNYPVAGVIGSVCSTSSIALAEMCGREEVSLLNIYFAGTPVLNNRTKYPFSYGSLDSVDVIADAVVALIKRQSWRDVSVIYDSSRFYYYSLAKMLGEAVDIYNDRAEDDISLTQLSVSDTNFKPETVISIQNKNRIVVFMADGKLLLLRMLCLLHSRGIKFPNYMFIMAGTFQVQPDSVEFMLNSETMVSCSFSTIEAILNTSVLIDYQLESTDKYGIKFSGISLNTFKKLYGERLDMFNQETGSNLPALTDAAILYDSLWSLSLALNHSMDRVNLSTYSYLGQQQNTKIIRSELEKLDFEGVSGRVSYNSTTGRVKQNISISLLSGKKLGFYTSSSNRITIVATEFNVSFISDIFDVEIIFIPNYLLYLVVLLSVISLAGIVSLHIATFVYRKHNSVKASSLRLSQVSYASCYAFIVIILLNVIIQGGFLGIIEPDTTCILQHILDILFALSLTLLFGSTCLRTWRLYRIFVHYLDPGKFLSDSYLLIAMGVLLVLTVVLVVPPVFINRYFIEFDDQTAEDNTEPVSTKIAVCGRSNYIIWFFFNLSVTWVLMSVLLLLTYQTRKIAQKNFSTKLTIFMLYFMAFFLPLMVGVYLVFSIQLTYHDMIVRFLFFSLLMETLIVITIILVFIPPLMPIILASTMCRRLRTPSIRRPSCFSSISIHF